MFSYIFVPLNCLDVFVLGRKEILITKQGVPDVATVKKLGYEGEPERLCSAVWGGYPHHC